MKTKLILLMMLLTTVLGQAQWKDTLTLSWRQDPNETIDAFYVYSRTNVLNAQLNPMSLPNSFVVSNYVSDTGWKRYATLIPSQLTLTNGFYQYQLTNLTASMRIFTVTASNIWGETSFSWVARLPAPPSDQNRDLHIK